MLLSEPLTGETDDGFENDSAHILAGSSLDGKAVVYINGSPSELLARAGKLFQINYFIVPGTNQVSIDGDFKYDLYIKIVELSLRDFRAGMAGRVIAKTRIHPTTSTAKHKLNSLEFNSDFEANPCYDRLDDTTAGQVNVRREVYEYLSSVFAVIRQNDVEALKRMTYAPFEVRPRWGFTKDEFLAFLDRRWKNAADSDWVLTTKVEDVKMIIGARSVIAYSGLRKGDIADPFDSYYLLEWENRMNHGKRRDREATLVRVNGRWEFL